MAQGQIKKGFFFYFGLFVLLLVAVFLICIVIMIFSPGTTVLWMQYFSSGGQIALVETTDASKRAIDLTSLTSVEIVCDAYTNVTVKRDNIKSNNMAQDAIFLKNNAKGFVAAAEAKPFSYSVSYTGQNSIKIEVHEQKGFFYLSKDVEIIIHATTHNTKNYDFANLNLKVTTGEGSVTIGGGLNDQPNKLASLDVTTKEGNISFQEQMDTMSLKSANIKTTSGNISSGKAVQFAGDAKHKVNYSGNGLKLGCDLKFETVSGRVNFGIIDIGQHKLTLQCESSNLNIKCINAQEVEISNCKQGNHLFQDVFGLLNYNFSTNTTLTPNIMVDNVYGDFKASIPDSEDSEPDISIKKVEGNLTMFCKKGSLQIGEVGGQIDIEKGTSLSVNLGVSEQNKSKITIFTSTGSITVKFLKAVSPEVSLKTSSGAVNIKVDSSAKFKLTLYENKDGVIDAEQKLQTNLNKLDVTLAGYSFGSQKQNPLVVNQAADGDGMIEVRTNAVTHIGVA